MTASPLRAVPDPEPAPDEPLPSLDYEWQQRQASARKDWAAIHRRADRAAPLNFFDRITRTWLR